MSIDDSRYFDRMVDMVERLYKRGVGLFKFDFNLFLFWQDAPYADILKVYREFYRRVREVAPSAVLIGCDVPLFESVGLFDYVRITKDVTVYPFLPSFLGGIVQSGRNRDIACAIDVRKPFDGLLWRADYDQIDDVEEFVDVGEGNGLYLAGFSLEELVGKYQES